MRPFKQEFGVEVMFDNPKIAAECDIIFVCVLPSQAQEVFKDIRDVIKERSELAAKDRSKINPVVVCTCAAISYQKLRLMLKNALLLKPSINVPLVKEYLFRAQAISKVREQTAKDDGSKSNIESAKNKSDIMSQVDQEIRSKNGSKNESRALYSRGTSK